MSAKPLPSPHVLRQLMRYDPETGKLFWKERSVDLFNATERRSADHACAQWNSRFADKEAFTSGDGKGYRSGTIFGKIYSAHRIIWALSKGEWPDGPMDHINGIRDDNKILNLRVVTSRENSMNRGLRSDNSSGSTGVYFSRNSKKWIASIFAENRSIYLGRFAEKADAILARKQAEAKYGFHPNHGRS